jgi:uncharacterized protein YjbJ (UPF0337 family)
MKSSTKDKIKGGFKEAKGKAKEKTGEGDEKSRLARSRNGRKSGREAAA